VDTDKAKRRVLYVEGNDDGTIGGSYFSLLFLVSGLDRTRFEPLVVFAAENSLVPRFQATGAQTLIVPVGARPRLSGRLGRLLARARNHFLTYLVMPRRLARILRRERIDLVHLNNTIRRNHAWMLAARLAGVPCITHERGLRRVFNASDRRLARKLGAVVCISSAVRENFVAHGLGDLPLVTIFNGLDPAQMSCTRAPADVRAEIGAQPAARLIGIVGNIKPWKGQEVVIRAMGLLREEFPDLACVLIGDTSPNAAVYREQITALTRELGIASRVHITGFRNDVPNYINALEIQVHASIDPEPFGRVLLEAMALSKPLVASNGGAVPEIVMHEHTGLLFEPGNPAALAAALRTLLADRPRAAAMGAAGRARLLAEFSIRRNVELTQEIYERLTPPPDAVPDTTSRTAPAGRSA
jgi:glycosyltransferase involved in cell wall biosynthesis